MDENGKQFNMSNTDGERMPISRAMGFTEYFAKFCHDHAGGTTILVGIAQVKGPLSGKLLEQALGMLSDRHPALRSSLRESPEGDTLVEVGDRPSPIPLLVRGKGGEEDWIACFEENLQTTFGKEEPPWRVTLLQDREGDGGTHDIVAAFHHSLSDGFSLASFFGELLECCRLLIEGKEPDLEGLPALPVLEEMLAEKMSWPAYLARKLALSTAQTLRLSKHLYRYQEAVSLPRRRTRILPCELDHDLLAGLLDKCRRNHTTLTGLLTASLMISSSRALDRPGDNRGRGHIATTPVNLRNRCEPEVGLQHLGCYVGFAQTAHLFDASADVWELARSFNRELEKFNQRGILPPRRYSRKTTDMMLRSLEVGLFKEVFHFGIGVTNIGRLPYDGDFGPLRLEVFHFGTSRLWGGTG